MLKLFLILFIPCLHAGNKPTQPLSMSMLATDPACILKVASTPMKITGTSPLLEGHELALATAATAQVMLLVHKIDANKRTSAPLVPRRVDPFEALLHPPTQHQLPVIAIDSTSVSEFRFSSDTYAVAWPIPTHGKNVPRLSQIVLVHRLAFAYFLRNFMQRVSYSLDDNMTTVEELTETLDEVSATYVQLFANLLTTIAFDISPISDHAESADIQKFTEMLMGTNLNSVSTALNLNDLDFTIAHDLKTWRPETRLALYSPVINLLSIEHPEYFQTLANQQRLLAAAYEVCSSHAIVKVEAGPASMRFHFHASPDKEIMSLLHDIESSYDRHKP